MANYRLDTDEIREMRKKLKQLKEDYEEHKNTKAPISENDSGNTHNELKKVSAEIKNTWEKLFLLTDKTIEFLQEVSDNVDFSDQEGAKKLTK